MTGDTVGGVWTFTLELARALGAHGVEVVLATMGGPPSVAQLAEADAIANLRLLARDWKLEWMSNPWPDVEAAAGWLGELEARLAPDVVHLNSYGGGLVQWNAPVVLSAHSCVLSWWRAVHREAAPCQWARYRELVARAVGAADLVTVPSRAMRRCLEENYGAAANVAGKVAVIANGRDPALFRPMSKEPFVLSVGRLWDQAKNVGLLAQIARALDWPVFVAGECRTADGERPDLGGCRPLGVLGAAELGDWFGRASIYALPARYEPFGLSALEAALSGCALVLGDIASLREIWEGAAVFVAPDDPEAWRSELRWLIADFGRREHLASRARRRALELTPERMARKYLECYREAIRQPEGACAS
jgi:glycogen(starch) synthase